MTHASPKTAAIWWPNQRVWRTALQVTASVLLGLVTFVAGLAVLAPQFLAALEAILPPTWYAWAVAVVAFIGTLAGVLAKIMAIPGVNEWLTRHSAFGTAPRGQLTTAAPGARDALPATENVSNGISEDELAALVALQIRAQLEK